METLTELLNTDNSLDRISESFEQLSNMMLSKTFTSKVDYKAISWLRNLYGDKVMKILKDKGGNKKKIKRSKTRRNQIAAENRQLFNEVLEILSTILDKQGAGKD